MHRQLFSTSRPCPFGCKYCFAKFSSYKPQPEFSVSALHRGCSIIYPNCDGELLLDPEAIGRLRELASSLDQPAIISFSTKGRLTNARIEMLAEVQRFLVESRRGFIKVSISFSTTSQIPSIEPGTATFEQRLEGLRLLKIYDLPCAVTIKPILPFVPEHEYQQLVRAARDFTEFYLLGDLYVDPGQSFFDHLAVVPEVTREISWLDQKHVWPVLEDSNLKNSICNFIHSLGAVAFHSEPELLLSMWERQQGGHCGFKLD